MDSLQQLINEALEIFDYILDEKNTVYDESLAYLISTAIRSNQYNIHVWQGAISACDLFPYESKHGIADKADKACNAVLERIKELFDV